MIDITNDPGDRDSTSGTGMSGSDTLPRATPRPFKLKIFRTRDVMMPVRDGVITLMGTFEDDRARCNAGLQWRGEFV